MDTINIIGIDPGNNIGLAVYTVSIPDFKIVDIYTETFILDNNIVNYRNNNDTMINRMLLLQKYITSVAEFYKPTAVGLEMAFLNMRFPKAVIQLSQYLAIIETTFFNILPFIKIFKNPPKYIKKYIGATGKADKDDMMNIVASINDISSMTNIANKSEHEIDALAIGYILLQDIKSKPYLLYALRGV